MKICCKLRMKLRMNEKLQKYNKCTINQLYHTGANAHQCHMYIETMVRCENMYLGQWLTAPGCSRDEETFLCTEDVH